MQQTKEARRRRVFTDAERVALLEAWERSGLSAVEFSQKEGVKKSCLWRWKRAQATPRQVPVTKRKASITFAPVQLRKAEPEGRRSGSGVLLEVLVGRELCVRVYAGADVTEACRFVHALSRGDARC
jgi:transposase-like protein